MATGWKEIGSVAGVRHESGTFNFYDGILTGSTDSAINGYNADSIPTGYAIQKTDNGTTQTAILVLANYAEYNGSTIVNYYGTLKDALAKATTGNTIKALPGTNGSARTLTESANASLASGKNIILDLNGQTISLGNYRIENSGTLKVKNGTINANNKVIRNISAGSLTIESGTYKTTQTGVNISVS